MMIALASVYFLAFLIYFWLSGFVLSKNTKSSLNRVCSALIVAFSVWALGISFTTFNINRDIIIYQAIASIGWCSFASFALWFCLIFTKRKEILANKLVHLLFFFIPAVFIYHRWTGNMVMGVIKYARGWRMVWINSPWTYLFYFYYISFILAGIYLCYDFKKKTDNPFEKKQASIIAAGTIVALSLGTVSDVILPVLNINLVPPLGSVFTLIWVIALVYAITKYRLMNITPATAAEDIIATMSDSLLLIGPDKKICKVNKATCDLTGFSQEDLMGKPVGVVLRNDSLFVGENFQELLERGQVKDYDTEYKTTRGKRIPVSLSISVMRDKDNRVMGIVGIAKDLSQIKGLILDLEKEREELDKKVQERTQQLEELNRGLEKKVDELEKFYGVAMEREEYIDSLEKEVDDLLHILGRPKKYTEG